MISFCFNALQAFATLFRSFLNSLLCISKGDLEGEDVDHLRWPLRAVGFLSLKHHIFGKFQEAYVLSSLVLHWFPLCGGLLGDVFWRMRFHHPSATGSSGPKQRVPRTWGWGKAPQIGTCSHLIRADGVQT